MGLKTSSIKLVNYQLKAVMVTAAKKSWQVVIRSCVFKEDNEMCICFQEMVILIRH